MRERSWEYVGKSVEEAIETALEELGLERDDVYVEILEEPQKGFLGIGGKEARIRVEIIGEWEVIGKRGEKEEKEIHVEEERIGLEEEGKPLESTSKPVQMINEMLGILGIEAMVEAREREDSVVVDVWGEDVAILIGKGGKTLDAIQYMVNICCRRNGAVEKRIIVDVEGYRKRRKARLEKQAEQMAMKAISQGESVELPPMSPSDRKIVHMALRRIEGVHTESKGEEPDRKVVIHTDVERST